MKVTMVLASCLAMCTAQYSDDWTSFKRQNGKAYTSKDEENYRYQIYSTNKKKIADHNSMYSLNLVPYWMRMNRFGDMLPSEVMSLMTGFNKTGQLLGHYLTGASYIPPANVQLPASVDWRDRRAVTRVKDQGRCGSSWAFSSIGALEGQVARRTGRLASLSEQNLIDCSIDYGNEGCNGGLMDNAFEYIARNGVTTEDTYPYEGEALFCKHKSTLPVVKAKTHVDLPSMDEEALKAAVATVGPVSAVVSASNAGFIFYGGGVFTGDTCDSQRLDHGVLVVGYDTEDDLDFWIVKNSWNTNWGEDGYIKISRNKENTCGIASMASYPLL